MYSIILTFVEVLISFSTDLVISMKKRARKSLDTKKNEPSRNTNICQGVNSEFSERDKTS